MSRECQSNSLFPGDWKQVAGAAWGPGRGEKAQVLYRAAALLISKLNNIPRPIFPNLFFSESLLLHDVPARQQPNA